MVGTEEAKPQNPTTAIEKVEEPLPDSVTFSAEKVREIKPKKRTAHATATPKTGEGGGGYFTNDILKTKVGTKYGGGRFFFFCFWVLLYLYMCLNPKPSSLNLGYINSILSHCSRRLNSEIE